MGLPGGSSWRFGVLLLTAWPLALELELARSPQLYLVLRQEPARLEVRSRGVVLASIPVQRAALLVASGEATTATAAADLELPALWRVIDEPPDTWRRQIAPPTLRPYGAEGPPPTPTVIATERPSAFGVTTDSGWRIEVTDQPVPGSTSRFGSAVATGWRRLFGRPEPRPPNRLVLVVEAESAQRLVHLLQPGRAVLLSGG